MYSCIFAMSMGEGEPGILLDHCLRPEPFSVFTLKIPT